MSNGFSHILRLGTHAEAEYFRKGLPLYDVLLMNANLVEFTPAACAALVAALGKPYFIDPFTHAFVAPPQYLVSAGKTRSRRRVPKRSFERLADRYFRGNVGFLGNVALAPTEVNPAELAATVLDYQTSRLLEALTDAIDEDIRASIGSPAWLLAPYFPMKRNLVWLDVNIQCLREALRIDQSAAGVVALTCELLRNNVDDIVARYRATGVKTVFLWIESFDEDTANADDLRIYLTLVHSLAENGIIPINLFGGFFSCIASKHGLGGFAHGLGYGENKGFVPVTGGGQPPPRYYFKTVHANMSVVDAQTILTGVDNATYFGNVCECTICATHFSGDDVSVGFSQLAEQDAQGKFTPKAYALCRFHFMLARRDEVTTLRPLSNQELRQVLEDNERFMTEIDAVDRAGHLPIWREFLA